VSVLPRQSHGDEGLGGKRMSLEQTDIQQLLEELSTAIVLFLQVEIAPATGHAHARLVRPQMTRGAHEQVHDWLGRLLARRKTVQVRHVRDMEILDGRALVRVHCLGRGYAVRYGKLGRRRSGGVLHHGPELGKGRGRKKLRGYPNRRAGHRGRHGADVRAAGRDANEE